MDVRTYTRYNNAVTMALGGVMGASIAAGNAIIPPLALVAGMALMYALRQRVDEVMEDERLYAIAEKAAWRAFQLCSVGFALAGGMLTALGIGEHPGLKLPGQVLSFAACCLLLTYIAFQRHYSRMYWGAEGPEEEEAVAAGTVVDG